MPGLGKDGYNAASIGVAAVIGWIVLVALGPVAVGIGLVGWAMAWKSQQPTETKEKEPTSTVVVVGSAAVIGILCLLILPTLTPVLVTLASLTGALALIGWLVQLFEAK